MAYLFENNPPMSNLSLGALGCGTDCGCTTCSQSNAKVEDTSGSHLPVPPLGRIPSPAEVARTIVLKGPTAAASCPPAANCSAISVKRFDEQPTDLQRILAKSFKDPAGWFGKLDPANRFALTSIFNRMCRYRLWCHVSRVLKIVAGEAPLRVADHIFLVPGRTPSVYFMSPSWEALHPGADGDRSVLHGARHRGESAPRADYAARDLRLRQPAHLDRTR